MYVTLNVRRLMIGLIGLVVMVGVVVSWSYAVGRHDGALRDRVEVCDTFGATDLAPCVTVTAQN